MPNLFSPFNKKFEKTGLGFTPCMVEEPLQSIELGEKEAKEIKAYRKSV